MSLSPPAPAPPAMDLCRPEEPVGRDLNTLVARKAAASTSGGRLPDLARPLQELAAAGGKRIRPILAMAGRHVAGPCLDLARTGYASPDAGPGTHRDRVQDREIRRRMPRHLVAALAGAGQRLLDALPVYALSPGAAFQLRNDLSGVFGAPPHHCATVPERAAK